MWDLDEEPAEQFELSEFEKRALGIMALGLAIFFTVVIGNALWG